METIDEFKDQEHMTGNEVSFQPLYNIWLEKEITDLKSENNKLVAAVDLWMEAHQLLKTLTPDKKIVELWGKLWPHIETGLGEEVETIILKMDTLLKNTPSETPDNTTLLELIMKYGNACWVEGANRFSHAPHANKTLNKIKGLLTNSPSEPPKENKIK